MIIFLVFIFLSFFNLQNQSENLLESFDSVEQLQFFKSINPKKIIESCKKLEHWPVIAWFRNEPFCKEFDYSLVFYKKQYATSLTQEEEAKLFHLCIARDLVNAINYLHVNRDQDVNFKCNFALNIQGRRTYVFLILIKSLLFILTNRVGIPDLAKYYATQFMEGVLNEESWLLASEFLIELSNDNQILAAEDRFCFLEKYLNSDFLFLDTWGLYTIYSILSKQACDKDLSNEVRNIALRYYEKFLSQMCFRCDFSQFQNLTDEFVSDLIQPFYAFDRSENTMRTSVLSQEERFCLTEKLLNSLKRVGLSDSNERNEFNIDLNAIANDEPIKKCMDLLDNERVYVENNAHQYSAIIKNGLKSIAAKKSKVRRLEWEPLESAAKKRKM